MVFVHFFNHVADRFVERGIERVFVVEPDDFLILRIKQAFGAFIEGGDPSFFIDGDDTGTDVFQNGFGVITAFIQFDIGNLKVFMSLFESFAAGLQLIRHGVEGIDQQSDFIAGVQVHFDVEVAFGHAPGSCGQLLDGDGDTSRHINSEPYS